MVEEVKRVRKQAERWRDKTLKPSLEKTSERSPQFVTSSGVEVKGLYTPLDLEHFDYIEKLGFPGEYPYTRGVYSTMYRTRLWTMRQYAGYGTAEETNRRYRYLLQEGQTGLSVAFDLPTQLGLDSDDPLSAGEVGRVGVAISSVEDMEALFHGIPLDKVSTSMTINAPASVLLAMYVAVGEGQGVASSSLSGTVQNDILKEYIARGLYIFPPKDSMQLTADVFDYCAKHIPRWNTISIGGYHIREAGANAAQELAFTLADGIAYIEAALERGLNVDTFAPRLSFFFVIDNNFFEEIAKFRAARRMWARIMRERFHAKTAESLQLRCHAQTSGASLTAQQPENNMIRVAVQALAAVLAGTQSLHANAFDEALALPTERSALIALRTQQILAYESGVTDTVDPLGGSYYLESLTDQLEEEAEKYLDRIESLGGMLKAVEEGYVQREVLASAKKSQRELEMGRRGVVGVNMFQNEEPVSFESFSVDPALERMQVEKLKRFKDSRDQARVNQCLDRVKSTAASSGNLMFPILEAVRCKATLGEICTVLREVFGTYRAPTAL